MESVRQGIKQSLGSMGKDKNKHHNNASVSVDEMEVSEGESESTTVASNPTSQDGADVKNILAATASHTASPTQAAPNGAAKITTITKLQDYEKLTQVTRTVKKMIVRFDGYDEDFVNETDIRSYLEYISDERLIHMPQRGSDWDRVLSTAQFFGLQITAFASKIDTFATGAHSSASAALASCQVLLEIGHNQAKALAPTFIALYELAMLLSTVSRIRDLEHMPSSVKESAAHILCELVHLIGCIASHYKQKIGSLRPGSTVTINFDAAFGQHIDSIWKAKDDLCDRVWRTRLGNKAFSISLKSVRQRLQPSSASSVRNTLYDEVYEHVERSEDTCSWITAQLTSFLNSKEKLFNIWGEAGVEATSRYHDEWVQERLARPLDYRSYTVLAYNFPWDSPNEATSLACVKSFIFQLLERSVGDIELYGRLVQAFEAYSKTTDSAKLESALWDTLHTGLHTSESLGTSFILLTDGFDEMQGGAKSAVTLHNTLKNCVSDLSRTRVITFSRRVDGLEDSKIFKVTEAQTHEDIRSHLKQTLSKSRHYQDVTHSDREKFIDDVSVKANGSFLWAFYAGRLLVREKSCDGFFATAKSISNDVSEVLRSAVEKLNLKQNETARYLLSFMLITNTPFAVGEIADLLSADLHKRCMHSTPFNIHKFVSENCSDFLIICGGRLHFRNAVVQSHFKSLLGKSLLSEKDAHSQLTLRMLLYARLNLGGDQELMTDELDDSVVDIVLHKHHLMGYVMRNWVVHFRHAGFVATDGKMNLPPGFRDIFPESVMFTLLERPCWERHHLHQESIELHELALRIRETCFGEKHITVLQSLISLGHIHVKFSTSSDAHLHGARYFYRAAKLGEVILSKTSVFVSTCTHLFLTWTESIVITERTEIVKCREEMIRVWIEVCKYKHGRSSDEVICLYEKLAKLYICIHEEWRATAVYKELYEIIVIRYGKNSPEAGRIGAFFGTLDIVLKGEEAEKGICEFEEFIFETTEDLDIHDHLCIAMMIKLAWSYYSCSKHYLAERLFISVWRRISITCRVNASIEVHIAKIQIALEYCKYLRKVHRKEEAHTILICLWAEYEHYHCDSETLIVWIRELGSFCRSFGLLEITITILTKVWGWFKGRGKGDDEEARKTTILITEVVEEVTETTVDKKTTTITTTEVTETVVKEIYETHYHRCKKSGFDRAFYSACMALIGIYFEHNKWSEAEVIIKRTLEITWKAILSTDTTITLCEHSVRECVHVAHRIAKCYHRQGHFEKAEFMYLRIYHACLSSCSLEDELLQESLTVLIEFYEEYHRHEKVIQIYIEILERYKKHLGHAHHLTIKTLYLLAHHCKLTGHKDTYTYYLEIVTVLNKSIKHCHHDAFEASLWLCRHYHHRGMWVQLREICSFMWETICHHRGEHKWTEETICEIYEKYTYVLEVHIKVEYSVLYKISVQYKEVIKTVCGGDSHGYILALITFARMCEKHESHVHEAVTVYEEVIKKITTIKTTTTVITETTVTTVKKRLSRLYVTIITTGKNDGHANIPVDRAIEICIETYQHLKITLGCWHEETLKQLECVIKLYHTFNTKEFHIKMVKLLEVHITEFITTCKVTTTLFKVAITLASIYVSVNLTQEGYEILRQLRYLIIFRGTMPSADLTLKLDVHLGKHVFIFLSAFEHGLCPKDCPTTYSEIMATIIFESLLYEEYCRVIEHETDLEIILECGAKLRGFWSENKRSQLLVTLDKRLFQLFKNKYATFFKDVSDEHLRIFYLAVLCELGKDRGATRIDFPLLAVKAGSVRVKELLHAKDWHCAEQLGHCIFHFAQAQKLYHRSNCIQYGYKLAEYLAGIDVPHPSDPKDDKIRNAMLTTSRVIMAEVLTAFRQENIDILCLRFEDISGLIRLLGAQQNWDELERLLHRLWSARERMQKSGWSPATVLDIGKMLVHAQHARKDITCAIETAELICYNLRRSRGRLDVETLEFSRLLATLYADSGRKAGAMSLHESVLREMISCSNGNEFGEAYPERQRFTSEPRMHLELLKATHQQLQGWTKPVDEFKEVHSHLNRDLGLELPAFDKWCNGVVDKNVEGGGKYVAPREWMLKGDAKSAVSRRRVSYERPRGRLDVLQTARHWWLVC
ncbi:hypothetical protein ACHAP5_012100 [Fusarium lateritium]